MRDQAPAGRSEKRIGPHDKTSGFLADLYELAAAQTKNLWLLAADFIQPEDVIIKHVDHQRSMTVFRRSRPPGSDSG